MLTQIKKHSESRKIIKGNLMFRVFSACKKVTAVFCVVGIVMITNTPLVFAYEAHTVNVTAKIVNDLPNINPPSGEFCNDGRLEVELSVNLAEADIYYTINGINPVCEESSENFKYNNEPFELLNGIITVKAVACHEELRNGEIITLQSAIMAEEFDASVPSVIVTQPVSGAIWYCNPSNPNIYPIEWIIENYRDAEELSIEIVYITDNDDNGIISEGDNRFLIASNLTGATGSYPFALIEEYCYYGYGWAEVTVTESSTDPNTDNCKNSGISGRIFDPLVCDSCNVSAPASAPAVPLALPDPDIDSEPSPVIDEEDIEDENNINENIDNDSADGEDAESENSDDNADENVDDVEMNNEDDDTDDETEEDIKDEDADDSNDEEESVDNDDENSILEEDGIIIDREEDLDDEEESDDSSENEDGNSEEEDDDSGESEDNNNVDESAAEEIVADDSNIPDDDILDNTDDGESLDDGNNDSDDGSDSDDNSSDDVPIENDDDSTVIEFSL